MLRGKTSFALLGARVTVVDLTEGQLAADREAATHYGYDVRTTCGDMRDLSFLDADSFDVVYAMTPCYVPSIREVYAQVARVLKPAGVYRTDLGQPAVHKVEKVDWDGEGYRISLPYAVSSHIHDGFHEFRHYLDDIFNGLSDNGLLLLQVQDLGRHKQLPKDAKPGSYGHWGAYVAEDSTSLPRK